MRRTPTPRTLTNTWGRRSGWDQTGGRDELPVRPEDPRTRTPESYRPDPTPGRPWTSITGPYLPVRVTVGTSSFRTQSPTGPPHHRPTTQCQGPIPRGASTE